MNNMLKRLLCLMMALMMVATLAACNEEEESTIRRRGKNTEATSDTTEADDVSYLYGDSRPEEVVTEEKVELSKDGKKLIGTWTAELDGSDFINDMLYTQYGKDLNIEGYVLSVTMTFNEDGTVTAEGDASGAIAAMMSVADELWEVFVKALAEQTDMSTEEVEKMLEQEGMTKEAFAQDGLESMFGAEDEMFMSGKWLLDGDELHIGEEDPEDEEPAVIKFKGNNEFHIVEVPGDDPEGAGEYLLPVVFKRVK